MARPITRKVHSGVTAAVSYPKTASVSQAPHPVARLNPEAIRHYLRTLALTENVLIHEQNYEQFLQEKGLTELGHGGEGTVYFTRGHVVKVVNPGSAWASLREVAHMLHLNRIVAADGAMGERSRIDWPTLLWVYVLSDGSLSIGMKPFDTVEGPVPGATFYDRLNFGPMMERREIVSALKGLCSSLVYSHKRGVIHHDLKPANIYIPSGLNTPPIVFDLGQALWQQSSWGRRWLRHEHNNHYWYNGTYRYMHHLRRLAHIAALAKAQRAQPSQTENDAFNRYVPSYYDDVMAFARILRDVVRSRYVRLSPKERQLLQRFYRRLMGLTHKGKPDHGPLMETGIWRRISSALRTPIKPEPVRVTQIWDEWPTMERVEPELSHVLDEVLACVG
ncbi:MAG TPA: hypothetical protein VGP72_04825 [Planctomycetota bacterium]|jgi:hypothetical protein